MLGSALTYLGVLELQLASVTDESPQEISCDDLVTRGYGDNAHVTLTDFYCPNFYVYEQREDSRTYDKVWIPVVSLDSEYFQQVIAAIDAEQDPDEVPLPPIRLIVKSSSVSTEDEVFALADQDTLRGVVINKIESLDNDTTWLLRENFADFDAQEVLILEHGREPAGGLGLGFLAGGLLLLSIAVVRIVRSTVKSKSAAE